MQLLSKIGQAAAVVSSVLAMSGVASAQATPTPSPTPEPTPTFVSKGTPAGEAALVNMLSQFVVVMNKPIYVYNWFNANGRSPVWKTKFNANDGIGYDHMMNVSHNYFQAFCTNDPTRDPVDCSTEDVMKIFGRGNMYGPGLYASTDPIATASYGGGSDWVLSQMRLPKGFRLATLMWQVKNDQVPTEVQQELLGVGCDAVAFNTSAQALLGNLLQWGNQSGGINIHGTSQQSCLLYVRRILKDKLKIDGLYYGYGATSFDECNDTVPVGAGSVSLPVSGNQMRNGAFVIANGARLARTDVKVFNSQSTDALADRLRITSLFYKGQLNAGGSSLTSQQMNDTIAYFNKNGVPNSPGWEVKMWAAKGCFAIGNVPQTCGEWFQICETANISNCTYVPLAMPVDPNAVVTPAVVPVVKISSTTVPSSMRNVSSTLLWTDLEGMDQDPDVATWIKGSLLGCRDIAPFGRAPNLRRGRLFPKSNIQAEVDAEANAGN